MEEKTKTLDDIKSVLLRWSESELINKELNPENNDPIDKYVDPIEFDKLISRASQLVGQGYDKTCLTVEYKDGSIDGKFGGVKFYLTRSKDSLMKLLEW